MRKQIMVIDEELAVLETIKKALFDHEIALFSNSTAALEFLSQPNNILLVILDIMISGIDGMQILKRIKDQYPHIGVVIMTAYSSRDILIEAIRNHADDCVEKPFTPEEFRNSITAILHRRMPPKETHVTTCANVDRIKQFIQKNYRTVSLQFIAQELCLSPKYLSKMFSKKNGDSFRQLKLATKITTAKALLENSSFSVGEIALRLGYQNPESFMRIFKRIVKQTPLRYRKAYIKNTTAAYVGTH